ncbi:hypothetical protein LCGC14_2621090 [marine sediment metagenome]|uniref:Uncharacterized protein n=1 Tax=marine sediment metagenome TaxID=412755 RepID=A0A0F8W092_9ZZZZ
MKYIHFKLLKGRKRLQDWFQFHIYAYNQIGICFSVIGYGFKFYFDRNDLKKWRKKWQKKIFKDY